MKPISLDHRCTENGCPSEGQITSSSCLCHKTREQVAQKIILDLCEALEPFVASAGIENALSLYGDWRDALHPIRVVVTKAQMVAARTTLAALAKGHAAGARVYPATWEVGQRVRWIKTNEYGPSEGSFGTITRLRTPGTPGREYQVFWVTPDCEPKSSYWTTPDDVEPAP